MAQIQIAFRQAEIAKMQQEVAEMQEQIAVRQDEIARITINSLHGGLAAEALAFHATSPSLLDLLRFYAWYLDRQDTEIAYEVLRRLFSENFEGRTKPILTLVLRHWYLSPSYLDASRSTRSELYPRINSLLGDVIDKQNAPGSEGKLFDLPKIAQCYVLELLERIGQKPAAMLYRILADDFENKRRYGCICHAITVVSDA